MSKSFQAATLFECTSWTFTANQKTGKHNFILSVFWFAVVRQWSYTNLRLNLFKLFAKCYKDFLHLIHLLYFARQELWLIRRNINIKLAEIVMRNNLSNIHLAQYKFLEERD